LSVPVKAQPPSFKRFVKKNPALGHTPNYTQKTSADDDKEEVECLK